MQKKCNQIQKIQTIVKKFNNKHADGQAADVGV